MLGDFSTLLPGAVYERDPTVDYQVHKAALHTMATCHSLRVVDDELLGDPLDIKMFEFTGWSFEELAQNARVHDQEDDRNSPLSTARPPPGLGYGTDELPHSATVSPLMTYASQMLMTGRAELTGGARDFEVFRIRVTITSS